MQRPSAALRLMPEWWGPSPASVACVVPFISDIAVVDTFLMHGKYWYFMRERDSIVSVNRLRINR